MQAKWNILQIGVKTALYGWILFSGDFAGEQKFLTFACVQVLEGRRAVFGLSNKIYFSLHCIWRRDFEN